MRRPLKIIVYYVSRIRRTLLKLRHKSIERNSGKPQTSTTARIRCNPTRENSTYRRFYNARKHHRSWKIQISNTTVMQGNPTQRKFHQSG